MANLFESEYLFGLHDPGGERYMIEAGKPGWIVFTEGIGHDPNNRSGADYRPYSSRGLGIITRLNNGYYPEGTIPYSSDYANFAKRCANFVANSPGCKIWIIGNEMNYRIERPTAVSASGQARTAQATAPGLAPRLPVTPPADDPTLRGLPQRFAAINGDATATNATARAAAAAAHAPL